MIPPFAWWLERLEVDHWENSIPGHRSGFFNCPVHGGSDSLHLTEQNGKALVKCFGCAAKTAEIVAALDPGGGASDTQGDDEDGVDDVPAPLVVIRRSREEPESTDGQPAAGSLPQVEDPLGWYADYCGVGRALIESLGCSATSDGWVAHTWTTTATHKDRRPNSGDRRWVPKGANGPRLWPTAPDRMPDEVWLCEGETDVICLRAQGIEAYTAGSASQPLSTDEMKYLQRRGVERIVSAYDNDKAGRAASAATTKAAQEIGLGTAVAVLGDPLLGGPKDWRERWLSGDRTTPETSATEEQQEVWRMDEVEAAPLTALLLGYLHPTAHTILFGDGGTGKGVIAAYWAACLAVEEKTGVLIIDYEQNAAHEWQPRLKAFGGVAALERVWIIQPRDPMWDFASAARLMARERDIGYVIIDSVTYACSPLEVEKSVTATMYSRAIASLKLPVLSLAHTTKVEDRPKHPFGSIFWSNGARVTIGLSAKTIDSVRVLEPKKVNQAAPVRAVDIGWDWVTGNEIGDADEKRSGMRTLTFETHSATVGEWEMRVWDALPEDGSEMSKRDLEARLQALGYAVTGNIVSRTLGNRAMFAEGSRRGWWRRATMMTITRTGGET